MALGPYDDSAIHTQSLTGNEAGLITNTTNTNTTNNNNTNNTNTTNTNTTNNNNTNNTTTTGARRDGAARRSIGGALTRRSRPRP